MLNINDLLDLFLSHDCYRSIDLLYDLIIINNRIFFVLITIFICIVVYFILIYPIPNFLGFDSISINYLLIQFIYRFWYSLLLCESIRYSELLIQMLIDFFHLMTLWCLYDPICWEPRSALQPLIRILLLVIENFNF